MPTPFLGIDHVAASQDQKEVTLNGSADALDSAVNGFVAIAVSGTVNLTAGQFTGNGLIRLTGSPGAAFTVNCPATARLFVLQNLTDRAATLQVTGGAGNDLELAASSAAVIYSDGANVYPVGAGGGGAGGGAASSWTAPFRGAMAKFSADKTGVDLSGGFTLSWDAAEYDSDSIWSAGNPTRLTVPAGVTRVRLHGVVRMTAGATGVDGLLVVQKNGSSAFLGGGRTAAEMAFTANGLTVSTAVLEVVAGDFFALVFQAEGQTSETLEATSCAFSMEIVETEAAVAPPEDVAGFLAGVPGSSAILLSRPVARALSFPAGMTGSFGSATAAATAQTDFDIRKNGVSFGTMRFAAAATTATFIAASATSFAAGDRISVHAPASADATLAGVGFALAGTRS